MFKISIPKPCFEGWDNMTQNEQRRYCNACSKTVVDFSVMSDEAVQEYFISNYNSKICGYFKNSQLQRIVIDLPENIFQFQLPSWKKFILALLVCFGGSFLGIDTSLAGYSYQQQDTSKYQGDTIKTTKQVASKKKQRRKKLSTEFSLEMLSSLGLINKQIPLREPLRTLGFCTIKKVEDPESTFKHIVFDNILKEKKENDGTDSITILKKNMPSGKPTKAPQPKSPEPAVVFILPTAKASRNSSFKKKKA